MHTFISDDSTHTGGEGVKVKTPAVAKTLGKIHSPLHPLLGQLSACLVLGLSSVLSIFCSRALWPWHLS